MVTEQDIQNKTTNGTQDHSMWFNEIVSQIRIEQLKLETGLASDESKRFYNSLMSDDISDALLVITKKLHQQHTIDLVECFLSDLILKRNKRPTVLAFDHNDKDILVWAEIKEDDEDTENAIYLSEAFTNYNFNKLGYTITATVVEDTDEIKVPSQYTNITV